MTYTQFKNKYQDYPLILSKATLNSGQKTQQLRNQIYRWQQKRLLIKLKRGVYLLNENDRKITPSRYYIANQLYIPSYVSLETALSFYGLIPEQVRDVTSVTTKKTTRFKNPFGVFIYQHIQPKSFAGFKAIRENNGTLVLVAEPEKAVVDFLYLNLQRFLNKPADIFQESYRFQNTEALNNKKLLKLAKLFGNAKLLRVVKLFCDFIAREKK